MDDVEGTGLGLSIAQWIVTEHGGELSFSSTAARTEFVVKL
jgi:nitrogen-specific signal transduction histidine kinase